MSKKKKRLEAIRRRPRAVRFDQLERVLLDHGWTQRGQDGSHRIWDHPDAERPLSLQEYKGEAKPYQVHQVIEAIDRLQMSRPED